MAPINSSAPCPGQMFYGTKGLNAEGETVEFIDWERLVLLGFAQDVS